MKVRHFIPHRGISWIHHLCPATQGNKTHITDFCKGECWKSGCSARGDAIRWNLKWGSEHPVKAVRYLIYICVMEDLLSHMPLCVCVCRHMHVPEGWGSLLSLAFSHRLRACDIAGARSGQGGDSGWRSAGRSGQSTCHPSQKNRWIVMLRDGLKFNERLIFPYEAIAVGPRGQKSSSTQLWRHISLQQATSLHTPAFGMPPAGSPNCQMHN